MLFKKKKKALSLLLLLMYFFFFESHLFLSQTNIHLKFIPVRETKFLSLSVKYQK